MANQDDPLLKALANAGYNVTTNPDGTQSAAPVTGEPVNQAVTTGQPQVSMSPNLLSALTGSANRITPDIVVAGDSSQAPRWDAAEAGPSIADQNVNNPLYGGGGLQSGTRLAIAEGQIGVRRGMLAVAQQREALQSAIEQSKLGIDQKKLLLDQIKTATGIQEQDQKLNDTLKQHNDTQGLLQYLNTFQHDDPNFEAKLGAGYAAFSRAGGPALTDAIAAKNAARALHLKGMEMGGAAKYGAEGQQAYNQVLNQGGDVFAAHAAAGQREAQHKQLLSDFASGFLTPADIVSPTQAKLAGNTGPQIMDDFGNINYDAARTLAAQRQGQIVGKPVTQEEKDIQSDYERLKTLSTLKNQGVTDTSIDSVIPALTRRIADYERKRASSSPGAVAPAKPAAAYVQ